MPSRKSLFIVLATALFLSGCASTEDDSQASSQTNAESTEAHHDCAAAGQKSYEMANGSIVCY
ncbi:hypothetical protein [Vibrio sp. CK2-1]|uniref:hypothetical protein n=1 Tax=Vibrio sp. CK2-1 TaxID=2912249 RepID=UPI001F2793F3|nr:hypothetical protein [Vibrio sp. CK2-1]MCF7353025.1 hypothetical protein [Vibrio sp. CK2-1]